MVDFVIASMSLNVILFLVLMYVVWLFYLDMIKLMSSTLKGAFISFFVNMIFNLRLVLTIGIHVISLDI